MSQTKAQLVDAVDGSIVADDLASNSVTTAKVADSAITTDKTSFPVANRNLIINGAMQVAQRGTSSTSNGYKTVDRWFNDFGGLDESATQAQADVASGTTPYTLGFRKSLKWTNGNQTSGAGAGDYIGFSQKIEAQDIANSGWNYLSSSSYITLSFWIKSSVAQNFYGYLHAQDGTAQNYPFETGSLSADTWTKITKVIPGNSNLTFNNDNGVGLHLNLWAFIGTTYTGSVTLNQWGAFASGTRIPNNTTTWYTTNDATLEITGVQLELGSVATDFEHRSYAQELALCERYFEILKITRYSFCGSNHSSGNPYVKIYWNTKKRVSPTITLPTIGQGTDELQFIGGNGSYQTGSTTVAIIHTDELASGLQGSGYTGNSTNKEPAMLYGTGTALVKVSAEL